MTTLPQQTLDAISTPAQVNTPLGTLQFPLGVPTDETQRLAYDHLDHVHAVNAFLNAFRGSACGRCARASWKRGSRTTTCCCSRS